MNMPLIFKAKCIVNLRNMEVEKKSRFGGVKMPKSNKMALANLSKKFATSNVPKQQLRGVVENGVLKM